jgi:hypothetical protein
MPKISEADKKVLGQLMDMIESLSNQLKAYLAQEDKTPNKFPYKHELGSWELRSCHHLLTQIGQHTTYEIVRKITDNNYTVAWYNHEKGLIEILPERCESFPINFIALLKELAELTEDYNAG